MSFNMNLEETTRLLLEAAKRKQLQDASKEFDEIKKHTLVLTDEEQKEIEDKADLSKIKQCVETTATSVVLNDKDKAEVKTKVENLMPYINESIDD